MTLVDDDVAQPPQERGPPRVARQQRVVQHVRIAQDVVRVASHPVARVGVRVAVEQPGADPGYCQLSETSKLVGGEGLRRGQIQRRPAAAVQGRRGPHAFADRGERRQQEAEGLSGRGACGEGHMAPGPGRVGRLHLVQPGPPDAAGLGEPPDDLSVRPLRPLRVPRLPRGHRPHVCHSFRACRGNRDQPVER